MKRLDLGQVVLASAFLIATCLPALAQADVEAEPSATGKAAPATGTPVETSPPNA